MTTRRVAAAMLLLLMTLLLAGCTTSSAEWSGQMPNENGTHVKPYDPNDQEANAKAINPIIDALAPIGWYSSLTKLEFRLVERTGLWPAAEAGKTAQAAGPGFSARRQIPAN